MAKRPRAPAGPKATRDGGVAAGAWRARLAPLLLAAAVSAVYANSCSGPLIFDDIPAIHENPSIRSFGAALAEHPEIDTATAVGRPLLRVSLWLNYTLGALDVRGYHVFNVALHVLASWVLFGLARRLLASRALPARYAENATPLATCIALLWAVHPLQTESVTYVVQRAEVLGGLFFLLTLYAVVRAAEASGWRAGGWSALAVLACLLGMASKEILATAPLVAVAMDRIFLGRSWRALWGARRGLHAALAATWVFQAFLVWVSSGRRGTVGFGLGIDGWTYALTQPYFLCRYLGLAFWPGPLTLDYGTWVARLPAEIVPYLGIVAGLGVATLWLLWRQPPLGFCGLWFFLILAPTSSIIPVATQTGAEHRMYLPLAGIVALVVAAGYELWRDARLRSPALRRALPFLLVALASLALGARTLVRNHDYRSAAAIWQSVVEQRPENARAISTFGKALDDEGRSQEAERQLLRALRIEPENRQAHFNLGNALVKLGRPAEAIRHYEAAARLKADDPLVLNNLAWLYATDARAEIRDAGKAVRYATRALEAAGSDDPNALDTLAAAYAEAGRFSEAAETAGRALALARAQELTSLEQELERRRALYQAGLPYRSPAIPVRR